MNDKCDICESDKYVQYYSNTRNYLCGKHRWQYQKYGTFLIRTPSDPNEIVVYDDYAEMSLYNRHSEIIAKTLIDIEDIEIIQKYKWTINSYGYVQNRTMRLHRFLLNAPRDYVVDHINHNKIDNRKQNLRLCTNQQNIFNRGISHSLSGYLGITWSKHKNKWNAQIGYNGKTINLGYYKDIEDAIGARKMGEEKYFGEFKPYFRSQIEEGDTSEFY